MNFWLLFAVVAVVAYLLGSLNFSLIISKLFLKIDVREHGSGNAGSTNALRVMGWKYTIWVVLGDIFKGVIACLIGLWLLGDYGKLVAGTFAVLGHNFPLYFSFRGGKGVLTTCAVVGVIDWRVMLISLGVFIVIVAITRIVSVGSLIAAVTFAVCTGFFYDWRPEFMIMALFLTVLIFIMHRQNIVRLIKGTENKLVFKKNKGNT